MKKYSLIAAAVAGAMLASGCDKAGTPGQSTSAVPAAPAAGAGEPIAIVNGKPISKSSMEVVAAEIKERRGGANVPEDKIVEELIKRELLSQEAERQGLTKDPKFLARLENAQRMLMSQTGAEHFITTFQITEEDLKKEYDQRIGPMKGAEYRARHILVDSEATAKDIIAKLAKGEKFEALAKKFSKDPGSKDKGGELGWFSPQQMVPPFSEAVAALKNGETTKTPVQSQFGWHVIEREESREQPAPPFDAVKEQLKSLIQTTKLQQHLADLAAKAKIENRAAKPAAAAPPAAGSSLEAGKPQAPAAPPAPAAPAPAAPAKKP
jgi:peptidyl-prolyl cis-trans isomerase C